MGRVFSYEQIRADRVPTRLQLQATADRLHRWLLVHDQELADEPQPVTVRLFGSAVLNLLGDSDAMTRRSDIDVAIIGQETIPAIVQSGTSYAREMVPRRDIQLSTTYITDDLAGSLNGHFLNQILRGRHMSFGAPIEQSLPSGPVEDPDRLTRDAINYINHKIYRLGGYGVQRDTPDIDLQLHQRLLELPVAIGRRVSDLLTVLHQEPSLDGSDKNSILDRTLDFTRTSKFSIQSLQALIRADREYTGLLDVATGDDTMTRAEYNRHLVSHKRLIAPMLLWARHMRGWAQAQLSRQG